MNPFKDLGAAVAALASIDVQLKRFRDDIEKLDGKLTSLSDTVVDLRIRVSTLEAERAADRRERDADKREMQAEISRFKTEVERFELRLRQLPPPTSPPDPQP